jgi:hypothetical protein
VYSLIRSSPLIEYSSTVLLSCLQVNKITTVLTIFRFYIAYSIIHLPQGPLLYFFLLASYIYINTYYKFDYKCHKVYNNIKNRVNNFLFKIQYDQYFIIFIIDILRIGFFLIRLYYNIVDFSDLLVLNLDSPFRGF